MNARKQLVDVVVPVFDEERTLVRNVETLLAYLDDEFPCRFRIVIADNGSVDATPEIGTKLAARHDEVEYLRLERKGRGGHALRTAWLASGANVDLVHGRRPLDQSGELPPASWRRSSPATASSRSARGSGTVPTSDGA